MTEHKLQRFHEKYNADRMTIFGHSFHDLSREDLIAVAVMGWEAERRAREEAERRIDFLTSRGRG